MSAWPRLASSAILLLPAPLQAQSLEERARTAAAASRAKTGTSDVLLETYVTPAMSGEAVTTIDGSKSFTPTIACQKSAKLLEVLIQPSASGDIGLVQVSRDKDMDGTFDTSANLPVPVSGICANGVLSCDPGTWKNCRAFRWEVDTAKDLKLTEVQMPELSGCYCVNNSCGSNLVFGNLATVLKDLGGGMVGALTTAFPAIGIAEARINGPVIDYVGALTTSCTGSDTAAETAYRKNPTAIGGDAFAVSSANSVFQVLQGSAAGSGKAEVTRSCSISRDITIRSWTFDDVFSVSGAVQSVTSCGTNCRRYRIGGDGACGANPPFYTATFDVHEPDRLISARIVEMGAEDWVQGRVNGMIVGSAGKRPWLTEGLPSGDCRISGSAWYNRTRIDITPQLKAGSTSVAARVRAGGGGRWGYLDVEVEAQTGCEVSERLIDLCAANAADSKCRLYSESVDGVDTVVNGVGTGLRPLPQTRLFGTGACTFQFARDFFSRERQYRCIVDSAALPEPDLSRGAYVIDHSTETLLADRQTAADGTVTASTRPFSLPARVSVPACEAICKTRAPRVNTDAAPDGVVGAKQNDPAGYDTFYHVCGSANACPAGPGEEIVSACGCLDDFPEAVVMMQTVRLAGADMVCTSAAR
ncbi:hypothetical protein [Novosphingobium sp. BW1]|uniref:hypothetical protein n=1 Tax=Novosphingobium sp. BW1 TaxID=2592621 RepID=UPI0011DEC696|nr:hypothetical protein [Novosphingobium sp. BW1]TYC83781.1 hypothetical protein FMM79_19090 [Novosphingobium sp. BW1]